MYAKIWTIIPLGCSLLVSRTGALSIRASRCDRQCLESVVSDYLSALTAHEPSRLATTPGVKYVENDQLLPIGAGLWRLAGSPGTYRHIFSDPEAGQVGVITTITENGVGAIYTIRLKVEEGGKVSEIETQITRDVTGAARFANMTKPEAVWLEAVPVAERISREMLIAQTNKYYNGMERNDPKGDYTFFHKECNRLEDGLQTTNMKNGDAYGHSNDTAFASLTCEEQFQTGFLGFVTAIPERRFPVVDEERQAVFAITVLDHNGTVRTLPSVNGSSSPIPPYFDVPRSLHATEGFRLRGEKLYRIEMALTETPYGKRSPFVAPASFRGSGTTSTAANPCDRACLEGTITQVLEAMIAHNSSRLPIAAGVRYSENGQFLSLGDGLWETLGQFAVPGGEAYAAVFSDVATGTAAYWGFTKEQITPGVLALRVKVAGGKISEIEAVSVRAESTGARGGTMTLMRPPLPVEWHGEELGQLNSDFLFDRARPVEIPLALVTAYFDGMERHSSAGMAMVPGCTRRTNGAAIADSCKAQLDGLGTAPNGLYNRTTTVRDRRILVADPNKSVVLAVVMVDNPATGPSPLPPTERVPSSYMMPQLIRIVDGNIFRVESMVKWMPYGYTSAWGEHLTAVSEGSGEH